MPTTDYPPPLLHPSRHVLPVLLSVPHSGRHYTPALLSNARHGPAPLVRLEDPLVDRLAWRAIRSGFGAIIAQTPRAAIDCNRSEREWDPRAIRMAEGSQPVGERARHGLGLIASTTLRDGLLWRRLLEPAEVEERLEGAYRPYHQALAEGLERIVAIHGAALLIDCHSMPPRPRGGAQVVIGDRHGESAAPWVSEAALALAARAGLTASANNPYAGGEIVARHGDPARNVHAIQLEICRASYLARDLASPGPGFDRLSLFIERLALDLGGRLAEQDRRDAAE